MVNNTSENKEDIEKTLIEQIMKYKALLQTKNYLSIHEREKDRKTLNALYDRLSSVKQKILDSKCYLHLGEVQKELASLLLQDETSHDERVFMLSYILRCVCQPIVYVHSNNKLNTSDSLPQEIVKNTEQEQVYNEKSLKKFECKFKTTEVSAEEINELKIKSKKILQKNSITEISNMIDWQQAEIISQMAASGEVKLKMKHQQKNAPLSIIIKETK